MQARTNFREIIIGLLLLVIVVGSVATCQYTRKGVSDKSQATIDSLDITRPGFDSAQLRRQQEKEALVAIATALEGTNRRLAATAVRQRALADSLAGAMKWQEAYYAQKDESNTLRIQIDSANKRADTERFARLKADSTAREEKVRRLAIEGLNERLQRDANKAANCRVAYVLPCITRTQALVGGVVLGAAGVYVVTRTP